MTRSAGSSTASRRNFRNDHFLELADCAYIHRELKRDGVTLQLLWEEHLQVHPSGYRYTQFCEFYRQWFKRLRPSMRQIHRAGEKTFIDFSGKRPSPGRPAHG